MTQKEIKNHESFVLDTYMETLVFRRRFPDGFETIENLKPILKFLLKEKRITFYDLCINLYDTLYQFRLRRFIPNDITFRDEPVKALLRELQPKMY